MESPLLECSCMIHAPLCKYKIKSELGEMGSGKSEGERGKGNREDQALVSTKRVEKAACGKKLVISSHGRPTVFFLAEHVWSINSPPVHVVN